MLEHEHESDDYASHVTLAEFRGTDDFDGLVGWLERNREVAAGALAVDAVELVEVDPREAFPALETVRRYELGRASANGDTD